MVAASLDSRFSLSRPPAARWPPVEGRCFGKLLRNRLRVAGITLPIRRLERHASLYVRGEPAFAIFLVESGWVKRLIPAYWGKVSIIDVHTSSDLVGEASFADGMRHDSAVAMSQCIVQVLPQAQFLEIVQANNLLPLWTEHLTDRLRCQQEIIAQFVTLGSERRLAARLVMLAGRSHPLDGGRVRLPNRLTHEELAAMVGTTRSRIGVFLANFERSGLIDRSGEGVTFAPARLRAYLEQQR